MNIFFYYDVFCKCFVFWLNGVGFVGWVVDEVFFFEGFGYFGFNLFDDVGVVVVYMGVDNGWLIRFEVDFVDVFLICGI